MKYLEYPTASRVIVNQPREMSMPAMTICNINQITQTYVKDKPLLYEALVDHSLTFIGPRHKVNYSDPDTLAHLSRYEMADVLDEGKHQAANMFLECRWENSKTPCWAVLTSSVIIGMRCYTVVSQTIRETTGPLIASRVGQFGGFSGIFNVQSDEYSYADSFGKGEGLYVSIAHKIRTPYTHAHIYINTHKLSFLLSHIIPWCLIRLHQFLSLTGLLLCYGTFLL